jgi:hypothetical protein
MDDKSSFKDDAEFAAIHMKELQGNDKEAAEEWKGWMDRYPQSPLRGEAMLAPWNALRRGDVTVAAKLLAALSQTQPWLDSDPRVTLAKGTLLFSQGKPVEALAAVGIKTSGPAPSYLRGLCYRAQGAVLQSAASFQEVADRYPDSPLRDPAMLAKADAFPPRITERDRGVLARPRRPRIRRHRGSRGARGRLPHLRPPDSCSPSCAESWSATAARRRRACPVPRGEVLIDRGGMPKRSSR